MIRYSDIYDPITGRFKPQPPRDAGEIRKLTNEEMASLPNDGWENALVDTAKYYVSYVATWEVPEDVYNELRNAGILCRNDVGMRVVALSGNFYDLIENGVLKNE